MGQEGEEERHHTKIWSQLSHNGMRSVVYQLGFDNFPRVRIGIGGAEHGMIGHVLGKFSDEEIPEVKKSLDDAATAIELIVEGDLQEAQARFNHKGKNNPKPKDNKE